jgi:beta-N-acetylhexosaminidase
MFGPFGSSFEEAFMARPAASFALSLFLTLSLPPGPASPGGPQAPPPDAEAARWVDGTLARLTLEQKIGQMICAEIAGGYVAEGDPRLGLWTRLARDLGVGGFVVYGGTPGETARLLNRLQKEAALPLLISSDFEGGPGQQIAGATEFPADMALSAAGSEPLAYEVGRIGAIEGRAVGIHLTYSPVADVSVRPENPAESVRTFGGDMDLLGRMIGAYIRGYQDNGMLATAKHFPGRGDVDRMPGRPGFTFIGKPAAEVEALEFRAFRHAIDAGVAFVMSEHIAVPSVTGGSDLPASVEKKLATGWLRERLGFKGVLTTDDLWYDQVVARFGAEEVAVKAVLAGHDVVLKSKDPFAAAKRLAEAVRSGEIEEARIDASVRRLLACKARLGLHKNRFADEARVSALVGTPDHLAVARKVADLSLTLLRNDGVMPVPADRLKNVVNISVQKMESDPSPAALSAKLAAALPGVRSFALRPDLDPAAYDRVLEAVSKADLVILSLFVQRDRLGDAAPLRERDLDLIRKIVGARPGAVVAMSYGNPHLIRKLDEVPVFAVGYGEGGWFGNQAVYFDTFVAWLKGGIEPSGRLPVRVSDRHPIGAGL